MLFGFFYILLFIDGDIKMILVRFIFGVVICIILLIFSLVLLGDNYENNNNKNTIFECGIIIDKLRRKSFSLRFFLFIILFLIFEIEIILFVPVRIIQDFNLINILYLLLLIIFLLGGGLLYEWIQGILVWVFNDRRDF